ncbi:hypothetical protein PC128_g1016 [Phytophthora cactorum]|nr:hypothetical protein PC128_g1016 [Phytophthora cactorum]
MMLGALKNCGRWDTVSAMFEIDSSPFQKMIKKYLIMIEPFLYGNFVLNEEKRWTMNQLMASGNTFTNFPSARYATNVTFQHADRPSGNINEVKKYFSGKHNFHGHKVEVSVLPTGAAVNCTDFEPPSVADVAMFQHNASFHRSAMKKLQDESVLRDDGPLTDQFQDDWAVLVDEGYQGLEGEFRAIQPKKKARGAPPLSLEEKRENDRISQDRVIVEYFLGRLKTLWGGGGLFTQVDLGQEVVKHIL